MVSRRQVRVLFVVGLLIGAVFTPMLAGALAPFLSNSVEVNGPVPLSASSGPTVTVTGSTTANLTNPAPDANTVDLSTSNGNITFESSVNAEGTVHVDDINGTWTKVSSIDTKSGYLYIDPADKQAVNVSGDLDRIEFRAMQLDDGKTDFVYAGSSGTTTVTVEGLSANEKVRAVNVSDGKVLGTATTDGSGSVTFNDLPNSEHEVELQTSDAIPLLDNPVPDGDLTSPPSEFKIDVEHDDFPGENVTVEFYYEGSKIDTKHTESDATVTTSNLPSISGGEHEWSVVATDTQGDESVLNTSFGTPGDLTIVNETNTSELITDPVNVTVKFENGTAITQETTSTGTINMSGIGEGPFIVEAKATSDYYDRTVYFDNLVGNRSIYMLNKSYSAAEVRFELDDPTGQYDPDSILYIQKPINQSGTLEYRTVYADRFGVEGVTADLHADQRYRLSLKNDGGTKQDVGPYRSDASETVTVRPGAPSIDVGEYEQGWASNAVLENRTLEIRYNDPEQETDRLKVFIHEKGNKSNQLATNVTYFGLGNFSSQYSLSKNESEKTWVVNLITDRDGKEYTLSHEVANNPDLTLPGLDGKWTTMFGLVALFMFAGAFSVLNRGVGAIMTALVGGVLWWGGWLSGATAGAAVVIYLFIAILYNIYIGEGP